MERRCLRHGLPAWVDAEEPSPGKRSTQQSPPGSEGDHPAETRPHPVPGGGFNGTLLGQAEVPCGSSPDRARSTPWWGEHLFVLIQITNLLSTLPPCKVKGKTWEKLALLEETRKLSLITGAVGVCSCCPSIPSRQMEARAEEHQAVTLLAL